MGLELAHHINQLLETKAGELSIVSDNHKPHRPTQNTRQSPQDDDATLEEGDVVTELFSLRDFAGMSFNIVSDNPRTHVRPVVQKAYSATSRLVHSTSAPILRGAPPPRRSHTMPPCARWGNAPAVTPPKPSGKRIQHSGLGPARVSSRSSGFGGNGNGNFGNAPSSQNASWGSSAAPTQLRGAASMDKKRLQSLGLGGFTTAAAPNNRMPSNPCRWTVAIPKRGSDSALIYPRRQRDF